MSSIEDVAARIISYREKAVQIAEDEARKGVSEVGGNNRGPKVREYLKVTGLGEGYPWCAAFVSYCLLHAGFTKELTASVEKFYEYGRDHSFLADRPFRGDLVAYDFNGDGRFNDHIGFVSRVLSIRFPGAYLLRTVEGNTSSGVAGSQKDGDGVFIRTRMVRKSSVKFIRITGLTTP